MNPEPPIQSTTAPAQYFQPLEINNEQVTVQPLLTPDTGVGNYAANILKLIESATTKVYLQTQYIHPPKAGTDGAFQGLIDAVKAKMQKGLDVKIILSEYEATGGWLEKLQAAGLDMSKVHIQNGVHNKSFVIDSKVVALGSQNWSGDGVLRNRDASLIIYHPGAAQYFEKGFLCTTGRPWPNKNSVLHREKPVSQLRENRVPCLNQGNNVDAFLLVRFTQGMLRAYFHVPLNPEY